MNDNAQERIMTALTTITAALVDIDARLTAIEAAHTQIAETVENLRPEVTTMIESLQSNPMVKMLLGGKR